MNDEILCRNMLEYESLEAKHTAHEILQEPLLWKNTGALFHNIRKDIQTFVNARCSPNTKILFTGAGTSEFVGNTVVPYLTSLNIKNLQSISTTSLVLSPEQYLSPDDDVLLVSCARSGDSPESKAAVELVEQFVSRSAHIFLTCNKEGALAKMSDSMDNALLVHIEGANDQAFAMTGSFTSMVLLGIVIFQHSNIDTNAMYTWCDSVDAFIQAQEHTIIQLANLKKDRVICLGSGALKGIAQEAHLKVLELSASHNVACFDTPLGFRHGPKSVLNNTSIVFMFLSTSTYTRKYELDMLKELMTTKGEHHVVAITPIPISQAHDHCHTEICLPPIPQEISNEIYLHYLSSMVFAQMYALENSIQLGIPSDNPSPSGSVNRIVQGVGIYPYKEQEQ